MTDLEKRRSKKVFKKIVPGGFFLVQVVLGSKAFCKCLALNRIKMLSSCGDNVKDKVVDGVTLVVGDEGESRHSQYDLVEYLGTIRKIMRKILPPLPDMTFLRLLGGKVWDPTLGLGPYSSSSSLSSKSKAWLDPKLPSSLDQTVLPFSFSKYFILFFD